MLMILGGIFIVFCLVCYLAPRTLEAFMDPPEQIDAVELKQYRRPGEYILDRTASAIYKEKLRDNATMKSIKEMLTNHENVVPSTSRCTGANLNNKNRSDNNYCPYNDTSDKTPTSGPTKPVPVPTLVPEFPSITRVPLPTLIPAITPAPAITRVPLPTLIPAITPAPAITPTGSTLSMTSVGSSYDPSEKEKMREIDRQNERYLRQRDRPSPNENNMYSPNENNMYAPNENNMYPPNENNNTYPPNDYANTNTVFIPPPNGFPKPQFDTYKSPVQMNGKSMDEAKCGACPKPEPCPSCARCPEPSFDCKKVPNYGSTNSEYLPMPVLNDFSTFGM